MASPTGTPEGEEEKELGVEVEIIDFRRVPAMDPTRAGKFDALIVVRVGGINLYTWRVPYEEVDTPEKLKKKLRELIKEELKYVGMKFKV